MIMYCWVYLGRIDELAINTSTDLSTVIYQTAKLVTVYTHLFTCTGNIIESAVEDELFSHKTSACTSL